MNTKKPKANFMLFAAVVLFATLGCGLTRPTLKVGELRTESQSVELGDADSVEVEIFMAAGELKVGGGANELLQADFTYNVDELEPEVEYRGDRLSVRTPDVRGRVDSWWDVDDYRYDWDLSFNENVPMKMKVEMGAGEADLRLGNLTLTRLDVETGAGDVTVDLSGASSLTKLDIEMGAGALSMDLTGDWTEDLNADITGGVGEMTLGLPGNVGVLVDVTEGVGNVSASNLAKDGDSYTNDAYGESEVTLRFNITSAVGNINLEAEPASVAAQPAPAAEAPADEEETQEEEVAVFDEENVYQDPEGRFNITLVGDWTPIETDGTYFQVAYDDAPLYLSLVTVETDDVEAGVDAALRQVGLDPAVLTEINRGPWDKWNVFWYALGDGQGVTVLGQTSDGTSYYFVATGPEDLVVNPPENVFKTIQGFSLSGEVSLPTTVEAFETYVNSFVGTMPPGLSIAIALGADVIYAQGFGMADGPLGIPATPDTVYQWASVTKTATAAAIMQLREQGLIDLDAPVSDYLDYFPAEYPITTVRHLLTHSSGLPEPPEFLLVNVRLQGQPLADYDSFDREYYEGVPNLMFETGSQSSYANPAYVTLGQIVAAVSGQPYVEYLREHILDPLGMTNTDFTYSNDFMKAHAAASAVTTGEAEALVAALNEARGLDDGADFFREPGENYTWFNPYMAGDGAAGGLLGPVTELIRFAQMMLNEGELDGARILAAESVALLQEVQMSTSEEPLEIGLAWHFGGNAEHPYIEHDGGGSFQNKLRLYVKDGFAVAIMVNGAGFDRNELADAAANVVFSMMGQ